MENVDVRLLSSAFQFGRYLLFSASTAAVSNLQGLWADGNPQYSSLRNILHRAILHAQAQRPLGTETTT